VVDSSDSSKIILIFGLILKIEIKTINKNKIALFNENLISNLFNLGKS
tara:strand:- start:689 stop:832 length:144 start_codon:yes stop_codon:yes gene_type:complete